MLINCWVRSVKIDVVVVIVQLLSCVQLFVTAWTMTRQAPLSSTVFWSLLKFTSIESVMLSNHPLFCHHFFFWLQSFPASGSFPMSWLFASGGQSIRVSASVFPINIQGWFPLGLTGLISLQSNYINSVCQHVGIFADKVLNL